MELRISTRVAGDRHVVALDGIADLSTVPLLQSRLRREIAAASGATIVVDVDGLLALDDVTLGVLLGAAATAREQGGELEVLTTADRWRERFRVTGFDQAVTVCDAVDARTRPPVDTAPYVAVIFSNLHTGAEPDEYAATAARMEQLAAEQPGFLGLESARGTDRFGITVSYWRTEDDARAWKAHGEHQLAQWTGRSTWYEHYHLRVASVTREYSFRAAVDTDPLLHLALPDDWAAARDVGEYRVSTRGRTLADEGFVHCSYPHQLEGVANRFYADVPEVVVLRLGPERLGADVREEPAFEGGEERFPHVYGPIPVGAVVATTVWQRGADGVWHRPELA